MRRIGLLIVCLSVATGGCLNAIGSTPFPAGPPIDCRGIPAQTCQEIVNDARTNAGPGVVPVRIRAVCTRAPCTLQQGDVQVDVQYSDGRTDSYGMGWSGPMPAEIPGGLPVEPTLPVEPACQGVPAVPCGEMALGPVGGDPEAREIRSIVVRCTAVPCTAATGAGDTIVTYADGTSQVSTWSYENGAPPG